MDNLTPDEIEHLVFLDESCAKTNMHPNYGWAKKGERCFGHAPCTWQRYTMLSSLRLDGSTESILIDKGLTKEEFRYFIYDILKPELKKGDIIILDNCRSHKIDFQKLERKGVKVKFLPRYSPDYNPIEMMWSKIKNHLRKTQPRDDLSLWREFSIAHLDVTAENARGWFKGCGYFH